MHHGAAAGVLLPEVGLSADERRQQVSSRQAHRKVRGRGAVAGAHGVDVGQAAVNQVFGHGVAYAGRGAAGLCARACVPYTV